MRITSKNKYISRLLGWLFQVERHQVEFIFIQETWDNDLTDLAFLNQTSALFEIQVEKFREALEREINDASSQ